MIISYGAFAAWRGDYRNVEGFGQLHQFLMRPGAVNAFTGNDQRAGGLINRRDDPVIVLITDQSLALRQNNPAFREPLCLHLKRNAEMDRTFPVTEGDG